jgi:hypothetical protein
MNGGVILNSFWERGKAVTSPLCLQVAESSGDSGAQFQMHKREFPQLAYCNLLSFHTTPMNETSTHFSTVCGPVCLYICPPRFKTQRAPGNPSCVDVRASHREEEDVDLVQRSDDTVRTVCKRYNVQECKDILIQDLCVLTQW